MSRSGVVAKEAEGWSPRDPFFAVGPIRKIPPGAQSVLADYGAAVLPRGVQAAVPRPMEPVEEDLLNLAAGAAYADRASPRSQTRWERAIRLCLAVHAPDLWGRPGIKRSLTNVLGELTGDLWVLDFAPRTAAHRRWAAACTWTGATTGPSCRLAAAWIRWRPSDFCEPRRMNLRSR
jgi:hypothetical protein